MILFMDTHDSLITIAIKYNGKVYIKTQESEYSHSIYTVPMIEALLNENNFDINEISKIIVVNGPGSFTGIRVGLSIAKTLAYALNIPIVTISSLCAYLVSSETSCDKMAIITDPKGQYISVYDKDNNVIVEEEYVKENHYQYKVIKNELDINKIIEYCSKLKCENAHLIKANYVKKVDWDDNND